jgi:hypothetical protein
MEAVRLTVLPSVKYGSAIDAGTGRVSSGIKFAPGFHTKGRWDMSLIIHFHSFDRPAV